jgi:oligopeptide/dipeptide ABC transporter ATP-binding protein
MSPPLLVVEDLQVAFRTPRGDVHALRGVSFSIERGVIFGLVGESGCGKSVTGRAILRLVPASGRITVGRILFDGQDLLGLSEREMHRIRGRRIAMIFQDPTAALNPVFTIGQQITTVMRHHGMANGAELRRQAVQLLADVGLPDPASLLDTYPHQLSGGMQQRAMIAIALSTNPDLLIADEPTTALDVTIQSQILDLLVRLQQRRGITIILITHNMGVVAETCQQVAVLYAGRVVEQGAVRDIFHRPRHPYTQGLLAALPNPESRGHDLKVIPGSVPSGLESVAGCAFAPRCEHVMEVCRQAQPPMFTLGSTHHAACYLYDDQAMHRALRQAQDDACRDAKTRTSR